MSHTTKLIGSQLNKYVRVIVRAFTCARVRACDICGHMIILVIVYLFFLTTFLLLVFFQSFENNVSSYLVLILNS